MSQSNAALKEDFGALLDESFGKGSIEGSVIKGTIVRVDDDAVLKDKPLPLNKEADALLPMDQGEIECRGGFFDLSMDGRWGGVITGDRITIDYGPCACGKTGPSIADTIARYADLEGDDKIGCAGTIDAYVRGAS